MSQDDMVDSVTESADASGSPSEPTKTRSLGDDWYLLSSQALEESKAPAEKEPAERYSKKSVVAAAIAAMLIGAAAAWFIFNLGDVGRRVPPHDVRDVSKAPAIANRKAVQVKAPPGVPAQTPAVKAVPVTNDDELARLRKENRRLVGLVEVLRRRSRANQNCSAPEQNGTSNQ